MRSAADDTDSFGRRAGGSAARGVGMLGRAAGLAAVGGVAALAVGVGAVVGDLRDHDAANQQTQAVLRSTGNQAGVTQGQIEDMAGAIENMSGQDDVAVQKGENMLLTFTNVKNGVGDGNDIFNQATSTLADMSAAMGTDMSKQAIQLGKALNDPIKGIGALSKVGVTFTEQQKDVIKKLVETGDTAGAQKVILGELNKEFGGSAEAMGQSLSGQLERTKAQFFNLGDAVLQGVLPPLTQLMDWVLTNWPAWQATIQHYAEIVEAWFHDNWPQIKAVVMEVFAALQDAWENDFKPVLLELVTIGEYVVGQIRAHWDAISRIINGAITVIKGIINVFFGVLTGDFDRAWDGIKQIVTGAFTAIKAEIGLELEILKGAMRELGGKAKDGFVEGVGNLASWLGGKITDMIQALPGFFVELLGHAKDLGAKVVAGLAQGVGDLAVWVGGKIGALLAKVPEFGVELLGKAKDLGGKVVEGLAAGVGDLGAWAGGKISAFVSAITGGLTGAVHAVEGGASQVGGAIIGGIKSGVDSAVGGITSAIKGAFNIPIDQWNGLVIPRVDVDTHIPGVGHVGFGPISLPDLPRLAAGGTARGAGWSWVGEDGPEALYMPKGASVVPLGRQGGNVTVNVYGYQLPQGNARAAAAHLGERVRRAG